MSGFGMKDCRIKLPADFQIENASVALAALRLLEGRHALRLNESCVRQGLQNAHWPGRFELVRSGGREFLLDGAHNETSIRALTSNVKRLFGGRALLTIFGTSREKDARSMLKMLAPLSDVLIITRSNHPRAEEIRVLMEKARPFARVILPVLNLRDAVKMSRRVAGAQHVSLITGSLFMIGEAREVLGHVRQR
jgi:dihydrofolate synthase/folylpolyglutamate synthase